jgi:hypothetical protein
MFITLEQFIKNEYAQRCENAKLKAIFEKNGGYKTYKQQYIKCYGFSEYLVAIRGITLTKMQTYHVAKVFIKYGKRSPNTIPTLLVAICRQYDIELPVVANILTQDYWQQRFDTAILK